MADIFEEVEEELRQDDYRKFWDQYGAWIIGAALAIIAVAAGYQLWLYMRTSSLEQASDAFVAAQTELEAEQAVQAAASFEALAGDGPQGYALLALLQRAAIAVDAGDTDAAGAFYDEAASRSSDPLIRDLAILKGVWVRWETLSYNDIELRLRDLIAVDAPYRYLARESIAAAALRDGDFDKAEEDYQFLNLDFNTPPGVKIRAQEALALLAQRATDEVEGPASEGAAEEETAPEETVAEDAGEAGDD